MLYSIIQGALGVGMSNFNDVSVGASKNTMTISSVSISA